MPDGWMMKNVLDISRCRASAMLRARLEGSLDMADSMADWLAVVSIVSRSPSRVQSSMSRMHVVRAQAQEFPVWSNTILLNSDAQLVCELWRRQKLPQRNVSEVLWKKKKI